MDLLIGLSIALLSGHFLNKWSNKWFQDKKEEDK